MGPNTLKRGIAQEDVAAIAVVARRTCKRCTTVVVQVQFAVIVTRTTERLALEPFPLAAAR